MRWRQRYQAARPSRPKLRRLTVEERNNALEKMTKEIARSPVLSAFQVQVRSLRGRFYLEWQWDSEEESLPITLGRISPLDDSLGKFLLEIEHRQGRWSEVTSGLPPRLLKAVAGDTKGTFHGLGSLDKSLRKASQEGVERLLVKKHGPGEFLHADSGESCTVQDALYHYFGVPVLVVAQPQKWYQCHRTPRIAECSQDRTRVLVRFTSSSWSDEVFGGACLYLKHDGQWGAYTIRPNQSENITTAERWLVKRKWKPW